jgi:aminopeptidase N
VQDPEGVIVHEFGHQFWYGLVGNNEFEEAWLDEGFNTYSTSEILDKVYGPGAPPFTFLHLPLSWILKTSKAGWDAINRSQYLFAPKADNVVRNAWEFYDATSYGINSYPRPALILRTLENYLGEKTMAKIMRTYQQRWRYKHPTSFDFLKVVNEVSGRDMTWFFNQVVFSSNVIDYRVARVTSKPVGIKRGVYDEEDKKRTVTEEEAKKQEKEMERNKNTKKTYESEVVIRREGEAIFPVRAKIVFEDGKVVEEEWDGAYRWVKYKYTYPSKIKYVQVDPENKILLDVNFSNNSYRLESADKTALKWSSRLMFWLQHLLQVITAFA